ncbi:MAG: hypothetical protein H0W22_08755 [Chloroflexi bacterium]|nr:hypothetical protein [Chloroflexota bacterium]
MTESRQTNGGATGASGTVTGPGEEAYARLAELESRLARIEGSPGLRERGRGLMARVMPAEAGEHFRNAGREQLLGVRSIVDFWIARLDEADSRAADGSRERETIEIE